MNFKKYLRVVKLTLLLLIALFRVSTGYSQITLQFKNAPMEKVLQSIKDQTGYYIFYQNKNVKMDNVSVSVRNVSLTQALDSCFKNQPVRYKIIGKTIALSKAPAMLSDTYHNPQSELPAQDTVYGTVTDESGTPLQGVTISRSKGNHLHIQFTDAEGKFTMIADPGDEVSFSYIGYKTKAITLGNLSKLKVNMIANPEELDSISVSTGYQYIKPTQVTGATSTITTKDYESQINTNFLDGLVNKLPGLMINNNVTFNTHTIGGPTTKNALFNIRGISTITGSTSPLIVLDDYPTDLSLNDINPNEIESVTILKDAAAAAIYGARASNGVLLIRSKRAKDGSAKFAFRTTYGITPKEDYSHYRWAPANTALQYMLYKHEQNPGQYANNWTQLSTNYATYSPGMDLIYKEDAGLITEDQLQTAFNQLGSYNNTADYSRLFTQTAVNKSYNLDISGGTQKALYYFTIGYTGSRPNQDKNSSHAFQLSGRTTFQFTPKFSLDLINFFDESVSDAAPVPDINSFYPYEHFTDQDGNPVYTITGSKVNPYYNAAYMAKGAMDEMYYPLVDMNHINTHGHTIDNRIQATFLYHIGYGFDLSFGGDYETSSSTSTYLADEQSSVAREMINWGTDFSATPFTYNIPLGDYMTQNNNRSWEYTTRLQLTYNMHFAQNHSVNAVLGTEVRQSVNQGNSAEYFGYNSQSLLSQPVDLYTLTSNYSSILYPSDFPGYNQGESYSDSRFVSGYGNAVYAYKDRYSITGSFRIDQANLFGTDPKYRYKPLWSVGAAWNANQERFLKDISWLQSLKFRVAYGFTGNVPQGSIPQVIASSGLNDYLAPTEQILNISSLANSGLRWEQTNSFNAGLDYQIFKHIGGSVDYYFKHSVDVMSSIPIDPTYGVTYALLNLANINNQGLEINLHADWISKPGFNWNTGFVFAHNTNRVLKVYQSDPYPIQQSSTGYLKGYPLAPVFGYRYAGLDSTGTVLLKKSNGTIVAFSPNNPYGYDSLQYEKYEGSGIPTMNAGLSNRIDIGRFYIYAMINWYGGFKVQAPYPNPNGTGHLIEGSQDFWKKPGDEKNPNVVVNNLNIDQSNITQHLDTYIVNGAYLTIGALTASYNLVGQDNVFKRAGFTNFSILLQASNLYTIGFNRYNWSQATGSFAKNYVTPTYTIGIYTNF